MLVFRYGGYAATEFIVLVLVLVIVLVIGLPRALYMRIPGPQQD